MIRRIAEGPESSLLQKLTLQEASARDDRPSLCRHTRHWLSFAVRDVATVHLGSLEIALALSPEPGQTCRLVQKLIFLRAAKRSTPWSPLASPSESQSP